MNTTEISKEEIWNILKEVKDPEVPVLDIAELGVLRDVKFEGEKIIITITPTYSGCPALNVMEQEIENKLRENGIDNFMIKTVFSPAWTTDWMTDVAKNKLREYGIAAPSQSTEEHLRSLLEGKPEHVACPFCNSTETKLTSAFGSTACKALHYCNNCHQPFEEFKCH
ncbi:MAG: 1,2-phenylacetyl-CoA epoxidase subunit PaaD [Bacteroidia bacterium]